MRQKNWGRKMHSWNQSFLYLSAPIFLPSKSSRHVKKSKASSTRFPMSLLLSVDIGTTSITGVALDTGKGEVISRHTQLNTAETTSPEDKARGRSQWDAAGMVVLAGDCLQEVARQLGTRTTKCL